MGKMDSAGFVKEQYANSGNLNIRIALHTKYSVNKQGFGNWIFEQYSLFPGCRILELGCGTGDMWETRAQQLPTESELILSDFSQGMVTEVQKKFAGCRQVTCRQINIEDIPYPEDSFDIVIANMMLYHVPNLEKALAEVTRVLKPDGKFYTATFGENGVANYLETHLNQYGYLQKTNASFTLQNGGTTLNRFFRSVQKKEYPDALEVTDTNDLLDYIASMTSMANITLEREKLFAYFETQKNTNGAIHIPKEYGMFVCIL